MSFHTELTSYPLHWLGVEQATVEWYRLVDSVYTFMLCDVSLTGGAFTGEVSSRATVYALPIRRLKLVAVDSKSVAASAAAAAAAAAERADGLPTANEGYVLGAGPSGADASDSESSSADDMPPPKAAAPTTRCGGSSSAAGATDGNETRQHTRGGANEDEGDLREADDGAPHRASDTHGAGQVDNSDAIDDEEDGAQGREGGGRSSMNQGGRTDDSHASTWADDGASDVSEEPLNSADDEEEDEDSVNADFEAGVPRAKQHLMVAQLDKVSWGQSSIILGATPANTITHVHSTAPIEKISHCSCITGEKDEGPVEGHAAGRHGDAVWRSRFRICTS